MPKIVSASYSGTNVLGVVQKLASSQEAITVGSEILGGDPRPGVFKLLTIGYSDGTTRVAGDGQIIALATARITNANYSGADVTSIVQKLASTKGTITVSNAVLGGDPRANVYKVLTVGYDDGSTRAAGESQSLKLD